MKIELNVANEKFYSAFKSYKVKDRKLAGYASIYVSQNELYCRLPLSEKQKRYFSYKDRAETKGLAFELNFSDFAIIISSNCNYCGAQGHSVDRINSKQGYIFGNVQPLCIMCNMMKHVYSHEDFINQVKLIASRNTGIKMIEL